MKQVEQYYYHYHLRGEQENQTEWNHQELELEEIRQVSHFVLTEHLKLDCGFQVEVKEDAELFAVQGIQREISEVAQ
jgi:hypothetical protein